jgi:cardiolipin synthase
MNSRILTVPNQLTFLRLGFLPLFIIAIEYDHYAVALGILVAGGISDALDGLLARRLNQKTTLGAYLDPIADKLLLSSSYLVLALKGKIAWWLAILVLGRDVLILVACAVILLAAGYRSFPPSVWGKATTVFETTLVVLALSLAVWDIQPLYLARHLCSYIVAALVMISGIHYSSSVLARRSSPPSRSSPPPSMRQTTPWRMRAFVPPPSTEAAHSKVSPARIPSRTRPDAPCCRSQSLA